MREVSQPEIALLNTASLIETMKARSLADAPIVNEPLELSQLASFLDNYSALKNSYGAGGKDEETISPLDMVGGDPLPILLSRVRKIAAQHRGSMGDVPTDLGESAVLTSGPDGLLLYLKGKRLHAIKESPDGDVEWLTAEQAAEDLRSLSKKDVELRSTKDMKLFNVMSYEDATEVDFGNQTYTVTADERANMKAGRPLPAEHPLSRAFASEPDGSLVMYSNPLTASRGRLQNEADDFAFALQGVMPDRKVYRDPLSAETATRVKRLNDLRLKGQSDIVAIIADSSFGVTDYKIVQNLRTKLQQDGVDVRTFKPGIKIWNGEHGKAVIVITGHIDQRLAGFITDLGRQGVFEGNYVVFNSCRSPLTRDLITAINVTYKAEATFAYDSKIDVTNVSRFVSGLTDTLRTDPETSFPDAVAMSVRRAQLNGIWTICLLENNANLIPEAT